MSVTFGTLPKIVRRVEGGTLRVGNTRVSLDSVVYAFNRGETPAEIQYAFDTLSLPGSTQAHANAISKTFKPFVYWLALLLSLANGVVASDGLVDPYFQTGVGINNAVNAMVRQPDGKILIGGRFTQSNGYGSDRLVRLNTDGSPDTTFKSYGIANAEVKAIALQSDGKILIGGIFTFCKGTARDRIARLNSDGTLDSTFVAGVFFLTLPPPTVETIAVQKDGKIVIGGYFSGIAGTSLSNLARLDSSGNLDLTFSIGSGASAEVREIVSRPDGRLLIGGKFTQFNSVTVGRVVQLLASGEMDESFSLGTAANNAVEAIAIQADGKLVLGGDFTNFGGVPRSRIVRINTTGAVDLTFSSNADNTVFDIAVLSDDSLIVGGWFSSIGGVNSPFIGRLMPDGSFSSGFSHSNTISAQVLKIIEEPDGRLLIAGWFNNSQWNAIPNRIARLNIGGAYDPTFAIRRGFRHFGSAYAILTQPDGKILVGGAVYEDRGRSYYEIVRLNPTGDLDPTFDSGTGANNVVKSLALQSDGKILIGGYFTQVNGITQSRIARLNSDGSLDLSFQTGSGVSGSFSDTLVRSIAQQSDGKILIGGNFTLVNGVSRRNIARLNGDGSLDTSFEAGVVTGDFSAEISAITLQPDAKILVGGSFNAIGGSSYRGVVRLLPNGNVDTSFNVGQGAGGGINPSVYTVQVQSDSKVLVGGYFTTFHGVSRNKLVRLNPDGSLDVTFTPSIEDSTVSVFSIVVQRNDQAVIVGNFRMVDGVVRNRVARLNIDGRVDPSFASSTDSPTDYVYSVAQQQDGKIIIGGDFSSVGQLDRFGLARLLNPSQHAAGFESDLASRPNGDGSVTATDVTQLRRFVSGLDTPDPATNEFQRIDSAPRATFGDGVINSTDVVQGRRNVSGLDPITPAGGPATSSPSIFGEILSSDFPREISIGKAVIKGNFVTISVEMTSGGYETAMSFTLEYDPELLTNPRVSLAGFAPPASTLTVNPRDRGRIGILIDSLQPMTASVTARPVVWLRFDVAKTATATTQIRFSGSTAQQGVSDRNGLALRAYYHDRAVSF